MKTHSVTSTSIQHENPHPYTTSDPLIYSSIHPVQQPSPPPFPPQDENLRWSGFDIWGKRVDKSKVVVRGAGDGTFRLGMWGLLGICGGWLWEEEGRGCGLRGGNMGYWGWGVGSGRVGIRVTRRPGLFLEILQEGQLRQLALGED